MAEFKLNIEGMHCGSCVRRVAQALSSTEGIKVEEVIVGTAKLSSSADPAPVGQAIAALENIGFTAHLAS